MLNGLKNAIKNGNIFVIDQNCLGLIFNLYLSFVLCLRIKNCFMGRNVVRTSLASWRNSDHRSICSHGNKAIFLRSAHLHGWGQRCWVRLQPTRGRSRSQYSRLATSKLLLL